MALAVFNANAMRALMFSIIILTIWQWYVNKQNEFVTITKMLDLVEKEALMICHTQKGLKVSMVTLIVRNTSNVVRRSMISRSIDGIGNWVQILCKSMNPN